LATVYHLCGIDPGATVTDRLARLLSLYGDGVPVGAILS
jgi:hypothetical protein